MSFLLRKSGQTKWEDVVSECENVSARLLESISADVLSVPAESVAHGFASKSTVGVRSQAASVLGDVTMTLFVLQIGLMIQGLRVDNTVVGGPAYSSQQMQKGDEILKVDNKAVTSGDSVSKALQGSDTPGSIVTISLKKKSTVRGCARSAPAGTVLMNVVLFRVLSRLSNSDELLPRSSRIEGRCLSCLRT